MRSLSPLRVLLVDDEAEFCALAGQALVEEGYVVVTATTLTEARQLSQLHAPDVVILDRCLPDGDGVEFLRQLSLRGEVGGALAVLMITAYGNVENAVEALKLGAVDYLVKPVALADLVGRLRHLQAARAEAGRQLAQARAQRHGVADVVGRSPRRKAILTQLRAVARSSTTPVLVTGPSGCGKQVMAEVLHALSFARPNEAPFVEVNCATYVNDAVPIDLFGRIEDGVLRPGLLDQANGGTLLLDQITHMPARLQAALLKFLEDLRYRPHHGNQDVQLHLRVVAATSADVAESLAQGTLRADLYHRLAVFLLPMAALRDCLEDVRPLAKKFIAAMALRLGRPSPKLTPQAIRALESYSFPGNVRELRNILQRAVLLAEGGAIEAAHIQLPQLQPAPTHSGFFTLPPLPQDGPLPLHQVERLYVRQVLQHFGGRRLQAAESLGISYPTFLRRLRELGMAAPEDKQALS